MKFAARIAAAFLLSIALSASAARWPERPVHLVVPFAPGGGTDNLSRIVAQYLTERIGQPVVVDNRPGAGGTLGSDFVAKAAPDGYTLLMATNATHAISVGLYRKLPYDPIKDFAPISLTALSPSVLVVHPSVPVATVSQLVGYAKAHPGKINYASAGSGSSAQIAAELFKTTTGVDMVHVPYKGGGPAVSALLAGEVSVLFAGPVEAMPHVKAGRLRALAVTTASRSSVVPGLPTVAESGIPGYELTQWFGMVAPAGTPHNIVARVHDEVVKIMALPSVRERLASQGLETTSGTSEQFGAYIKAEVDKMVRVVKASGAHID